MRKILVDTSVWVDHLRKNNFQLKTLLDNNQVLCHPFIIGELACGNIDNREEILRLLKNLASADLVESDEILDFIDFHQMMSKGIGLIDMHLLASALLSEVSIWSLDKKMVETAKRLHLHWRDSEN